MGVTAPSAGLTTPAPQRLAPWAHAVGARVTELDGDEEVEIPPGTQPSTVITLRGKGMPSLRTRRRGDQRVMVNVVIPRALTDEQRRLLEQLNDSLTEENLREHADDDSLLGRVRRAFR